MGIVFRDSCAMLKTQRAPCRNRLPQPACRTAQNRNRKGVFTEKRMAEKIWNAPHPDEIASVFGSYDANINLIQKQFQVVIVNRNTGIKISGIPFLT